MIGCDFNMMKSFYQLVGLGLARGRKKVLIPSKAAIEVWQKEGLMRVVEFKTKESVLEQLLYEIGMV